MWWQELSKELSRLLFPSPQFCLICRRYLQDEGLPICGHCVIEYGFNWKCFTSGDDLCFSFGLFQGRLKELLHVIKYQGGFDACRALGLLLGLAIREESRLQDANYLLPVPLHSERLAKRGFNQAEVLADNIIKIWKRKVFRKAVRIKNTVPQSDLSFKQRIRNLDGAFWIVEPTLLNGKHVIIIDDIYTTGTTYRQLSRLIKSFGGRTSGVFVCSGPR
ncbi:MAG: ComF family protein [Firmicutes bacterium]|nr:ComF family protein [Bacillota bacterium]